MSVKVIVGTQWGDEGKGKITDMLAEKVDLVVRYQGGNNAGHTVVVGDDTFKLHLIPSGILYDSVTSVIGNGVVIDPAVFLQEVNRLKDQGVNITANRLKVSSLSHVILPFHKLLDSKQEEGREDQKIGTTGRGIGPAYTDKVSRMGVRILDILDREKLLKRLQSRNWEEILPGCDLDIEKVADEYATYGQEMAQYVTDTSLYVNESIKAGKKIIMEGAQGTLLDVDHGTYPFVTSSNPISGAACTGAGIGPNKIDQVIGVVKAYSSRVGEGPFPTEETDEMGEYLREKGCEFGTTTSRPRRCGWLDLVVLRYAIRVNGLTEICLTKLDVLDELKKIKICTAYDTPDGRIKEFPVDGEVFENATPVYDELPGWEEDISQLNSYDELPDNAKRYIKYLENTTGVTISLVSVGSKRSQTIHLLEA